MLINIDKRALAFGPYILFLCYTPLQKKRNTGVNNPIGAKSWELPLFTTFLPHGVADPKVGSGRLLDQVLRFFWRGMYKLPVLIYKGKSNNVGKTYEDLTWWP